MAYEIVYYNKNVLWSHYRRLKNHFRAQGKDPAQVKINDKERVLRLQNGNINAKMG